MKGNRLSMDLPQAWGAKRTGSSLSLIQVKSSMGMNTCFAVPSLIPISQRWPVNQASSEAAQQTRCRPFRQCKIEKEGARILAGSKQDWQVQGRTAGFLLLPSRFRFGKAAERSIPVLQGCRKDAMEEGRVSLDGWATQLRRIKQEEDRRYPKG